MKKMRFLTFIALAFMLLLSSCSDKQNTGVSDYNYEKVQISKKLSEYDSPYTKYYENTDGTYTFFLYAAPVQYYDGNGYSEIDNKIVSSSKDGYAFENTTNDIKTYFSESIKSGVLLTHKDSDMTVSLDNDDYQTAKLVEYENMHGDVVSAVNYCGNDFDVFFYLSNTGLRIEVVQEQSEYKAFDLMVESSGSLNSSLFDDCLLIDLGSDTASGMGYSMLTSYINGNGKAHFLKNKFVVYPSAEQGGKIHLSVEPSTAIDNSSAKGKAHSECAIEFYANKMPDSTALSNAGGHYLSNCSMVGMDSNQVIGYHYLRTRIGYFSSIEPETILHATYSFRSFSDVSPDSIFVAKNKEKWSSAGMSWDTKPNSEKEYMNVKVDNNYLVADITEYAKDSMGLFGDKLEYRGLGILSTSTTPIYFATSDNTKYPPYITLYLSELPKDFVAQNDIN